MTPKEEPPYFQTKAKTQAGQYFAGLVNGRSTSSRFHVSDESLGVEVGTSRSAMKSSREELLSVQRPRGAQTIKWDALPVTNS